MSVDQLQRDRRSQRTRKRKKNIEQGFVPLSQALQNESRPAGWKSLAMAIIEQAVMDYCLLVRNGYVKELEYTGKPLLLMHGGSRRAHVQGIYADMMLDLIDFWKKGRCMNIINLAMYEREYTRLTADMIRKGLLRMEAIGNIWPKGQRR